MPKRAPVITAIYPGTFDPVTNGHVDVIERAAGIFDRLVIGVVGNPQHKQPMFTLDERVAFLTEALDGLQNVEVDVFSELVVEFARKWEAKAIVKGLRVISDFEWELQMNQLNRRAAAIRALPEGRSSCSTRRATSVSTRKRRTTGSSSCARAAAAGSSARMRRASWLR